MVANTGGVDIDCAVVNMRGGADGSLDGLTVAVVAAACVGIDMGAAVNRCGC